MSGQDPRVETAATAYGAMITGHKGHERANSETRAALAAFASAGLIGSDAGTSFKTMLQRLNPQSAAAATLMDELGLSAYDAQGEFVGLSEYAGKLQAGLKDMSSEQRNAAMNTLFGSDAVRAAAVLYEQGADGVQKWEDARDVGRG